jgi:hypothetical protein
LAVAPGIRGGATVYASWNGATLVGGWRVLGGGEPRSLTPLAEAPRRGFETAISLPAAPVGPYVSVQALDAGGAVIGTSRTIKLSG